QDDGVTASAHRRASRDSSGHRRPSPPRSMDVRRPPVASLDTRPGQARFLLFPLPAGSASPNYPQRICRKYPLTSIPGRTDKVTKGLSTKAPLQRRAGYLAARRAKAEGVDNAQESPTCFKNL